MAFAFESLPFIDYDDPAFAADPFGWLAETARQTRLARSFRGLDLLDYRLCREFFVNRNLGNGHLDLVELVGLPEGSEAMTFKRKALDGLNRGDARARLRKAMLQVMGPARALDLKATIAGVVAGLVQDLPQEGVVDLKFAFADLVPARVYCAWVNAPMADDRFVMEMSESTLQIFDRDPGAQERIVAGFARTFAYVRERIAERRRAPGQDLLSELVAMADAGALTEDELEVIGVMLIEGSSDNTAHQISIAVDHLSAMPDLWKRLGQEPDLVADAVREVMRLWPRSISTTRKAMEDIEIDGVLVPAGTNVFASFGAAQRQADVFEQPEAFRLGRNLPLHHMNFGGGAFSCLGQYVALIETEEAVSQLARRYPNLSVRHGERACTAMFNSVKRLDVSLAG